MLVQFRKRLLNYRFRKVGTVGANQDDFVLSRVAGFFVGVGLLLRFIFYFMSGVSERLLKEVPHLTSEVPIGLSSDGPGKWPVLIDEVRKFTLTFRRPDPDGASVAVGILAS